jgi:catalase
MNPCSSGHGPAESAIKEALMAEPQQPQDDRGVDEGSKDRQLEPFRRDDSGQFLTTNQGVRVHDDNNQLTAGDRGPTLMEDFIFREKMTHFDHESIPERVVHARGSGAHGYFEPYESMKKVTKAKFLSDPATRTPVFVRFSTVVGSRGSADTVRDVRGFATKFYTEEGVFDLVGNNIPVFFIQDANKFPDLVHAIKPMPDNEMPQASAAHDTFWDFASLMPELAHMLMWVLSDRAIPRSFRMMEGFGVNTFRFVNDAGEARFIKWHWRPVLGTHSLVWDEAQKLAGKDPDWLRRDLWEAIEMGEFPEFELCVQMVEEKDEFKFDFDVLDATKIWPEADVPLMKVGKMVLNRNPDNFFAETEQVAFHPGHVVPGIDVTNDPLLQGRLFSYLDTQLNRFGSANFHEVPINRPVVPVNNNQGAGFMRMTMGKGKVNYFPNSLGGGCPMHAPENRGAYAHYMEKVDGHKVRARSKSFGDHFTQAAMFYRSLSDSERERLIQATHFELGKVDSVEVRHRMVHEIFNKIDHDLAVRCAEGIGIEPPKGSEAPAAPRLAPEISIDLHSAKTDSIKSRRVAVLAAEGFDHAVLEQVMAALTEAGAHPKVVAKFKGMLKSEDGQQVEVDKSHVTTGSIMFDAVFVVSGRRSADAMKQQGDALHFINEAFKHGKAIGAVGEGIELIQASNLTGVELARPDSHDGAISRMGVVTSPSASGLDDFIAQFTAAIARHRHWERAGVKDTVPA